MDSSHNGPWSWQPPYPTADGTPRQPLYYLPCRLQSLNQLNLHILWRMIINILVSNINKYSDVWCECLVWWVLCTYNPCTKVIKNLYFVTTATWNISHIGMHDDGSWLYHHKLHKLQLTVEQKDLLMSIGWDLENTNSTNSLYQSDLALIFILPWIQLMNHPTRKTIWFI